MRIVSWNVHGCVGADFRCAPGRTLDTIRRLAPDILALQEIDGRTHFGRRSRAFETFAEALGDHRIEARTVTRSDRDYGHLLWSRWPIEEGFVRRLPGGRIEPRAVIDAVCRTPHGRLRVLAAHFGLFPGDRRRQGEAVAALADDAAGPTVALGDFNEWHRTGRVHRALSAVLPVQLAPPTWPARRPFVRIDRLYASAEVLVRPVAALEDDVRAMARRASDHLPLVADLLLPAKWLGAE